MKHTRSVGRTLLVLFSVSVVFSIGFVAWAFAVGNSAKDIRTWISAVPAAAVGMWNRNNRQGTERLMRDYMRLTQARRKWNPGLAERVPINRSHRPDRR